MSAVDEIKARLDIVEVVGAYVPLHKAGRSFKAVCPFHTEKTPSFIVNPDRQTWHCFGACGTGGDIFAFVARKENLDFSGALRLLAERAGVELDRGGPRREELKTLYDLNEAAALYFHSLLLNGSPALAYAQERGLDAAAIRDFQLGLSPPGWDGLRGHLGGRGFADAMLIEVGLVIASDRGGYDRFRGRLMFPIRDDRGRIAGFGARSLPAGEAGLPGASDDTGAKYINTPQTPIFDKGSILYALDRAKDAIRNDGTGVIVEGYMDVIAAHQNGFRNVVASMGTSLTDRQATLAQRFASTVVLAMDADEAGNAAALRGIQVVAAAAERAVATRRGEAGARQTRALDIRVAALPPGVDPDELVRNDRDAWERLVRESRPVVDHLLTVTASTLDLENPRQRAMLVAEVLPAIGDVVDPVLRANYVQQLSQKARMGRSGEDTLNRQLVTMRRQRTRSDRPAAEQATQDASHGPAGVSRLRSPGEEFLLALLYLRPEVAGLAGAVAEDLFTLSENRELFRRWREGEAVDEDDEALWEPYQDVRGTRLPRLETGMAEAAFLDCVARLEQGKMRSVKEASALALAEGEAGVRPGQVASIARRRWEAGQTEETEADAAEGVVASQLLEDMEAGLRFHRRLIEGTRSDRSGRSFQEPVRGAQDKEGP